MEIGVHIGLFNHGNPYLHQVVKFVYPNYDITPTTNQMPILCPKKSKLDAACYL